MWRRGWGKGCAQPEGGLLGEWGGIELFIKSTPDWSTGVEGGGSTAWRGKWVTGIKNTCV